MKWGEVVQVRETTTSGKHKEGRSDDGPCSAGMDKKDPGSEVKNSKSAQFPLASLTPDQCGLE